MSKKELGRVGVLARVKSEELGVVDAAQLLRVSYRQAKRLWKRFREEGAAGLQHGSAGRPSNRAHDKKFRKKVLRLVREKYGGAVGERFGPPRAAERDRIFRLESEEQSVGVRRAARHAGHRVPRTPAALARGRSPGDAKASVEGGRHATIAGLALRFALSAPPCGLRRAALRARPATN